MTQANSHAPSEKRFVPFAKALRTRALSFAVFWFGIWPFFAVLAGAVDVVERPLTATMPHWVAFGGVCAGLLYTASEFLACAAFLYAVSLVVFSLCDPGEITDRRWLVRLAEPAVALCGIAFGVATEYPALLNHPAFTPLRRLHVYQAYLVAGLSVWLFALLLGRVRRNTRAYIRYSVVAITFIAVGVAITRMPLAGSDRHGSQDSTVILGLDSMAQSMNVSTLRNLSKQHGGAYYEHAVTPGLLTNSVWASLMMHRPVHETGVVLIFQTPDWNQSDFHLVREAKRRGYETWAYFDDQTTCYVGSTGDFDHNHSSPTGWLQMATSTFKNGSLLIPFILSRLPEVPFARTPRNQAATYAYDLRAEMRAILTSGQGSRPTLVLAHLDYLHFPAYPRLSELTTSQRRLLFAAPVSALQDFSDHWQYPSPEDEPLGLYLWKIQNLQRVVVEEIEATGFLNPERRNRLAIFSDHGMRIRLTTSNFGQRGYYEVPLITFGVPARNVSEPISTLDIPSLFGFEDSSHNKPAEPVVEYVDMQSMEEWQRAIQKARWGMDGRVEFSEDIVAKYKAALKAYRPYDKTPGYGAP